MKLIVAVLALTNAINIKTQTGFYVDSNGVQQKTFIADDESKYEERYKAIVRNEEKGKESHEEYAAHPSTPSGYAWDTNPPAAAAAAPAEKAEAAKDDEAKADAPKEEKKAAEPAAEAKKEDAAAPKKEEAAKK